MARGATPAGPMTMTARPERVTTQPLPSTTELLTEGGDQRIRLDPKTGLNRYGCPPSPSPELAAFGSSTASAISLPALDAARRLRERLLGALATSGPADVYERETARLRADLIRLCGLDGQEGLQAVIAASGTDMHMLIAQLIGDGPIRVILGEAAETGRGVPAALSGLHYGSCAPYEAATTPGEPIAEGPSPEIVHVAARDAGGLPRDPAVADAEVEALAAEAIGEGRRVLLVVTDASKTGLISPSPAVARTLEQRFRGRLDVLVDACQLRLSAATLQAYAAQGWMIAVTGSKFLTGPAFSGALFIPAPIAARLRERTVSPRLSAFSARADWPEGWAIRACLDPHPNFGLLLRWEAALEELRRFRAVPQAVVGRFLSRFALVARAGMAEGSALRALPGRPLDRGVGPAGGWDRMTSIFPFTLWGQDEAGVTRRLTADETTRVYDLMRRDLSRRTEDPRLQAAAALPVELGQPVACGEDGGQAVSALRLCASARLIAEAGVDPARADEILAQAGLALTKAAWLAGEAAGARL